MALPTRRFNSDFAAEDGDLGDIYPTGVTMPAGYSPSNDKDVATKDYVESLHFNNFLDGLNVNGQLDSITTAPDYISALGDIRVNSIFSFLTSDVSDLPTEVGAFVGGGVLETHRYSSNIIRQQIAVFRSGDYADWVWDRYSVSAGVWSSWRASGQAVGISFSDAPVLYTAANVQAALEAGEFINYMEGFEPGNINVLFTGSVDTLDTGVRHFVGTAVTGTLPTDLDTSKYFVMETYGRGGRWNQTLRCADITNEFYEWERVYYSTGWRAWKRKDNAAGMLFDDSSVKYTATTVQTALENGEFINYLDGLDVDGYCDVPTETNLNNIGNNSVWRGLGSTFTNMPSDSFSGNGTIVVTYGYTSLYCVQIVYQMAALTKLYKWERYKLNGTWSSWLNTTELPWVDISSFSNSWGHYAAGSEVGYTRVGRIVRLRGLIGGGTGMGTGAFTLPTGFRPPYANNHFLCASSPGSGIARVVVSSSGVVTMATDVVGSGGTTWTDLSTISFSTEA